MHVKDSLSFHQLTLCRNWKYESFGIKPDQETAVNADRFFFSGQLISYQCGKYMSCRQESLL